MSARGDTFTDGLGCLLVIALILGAAWLGYRKWQAEQDADRAALLAKYEVEQAERRRRMDLELCVAAAEDARWRYAKLNGAREKKGQPGVFTADERVWDAALRIKNSKLAECTALYGR